MSFEKIQSVWLPSWRQALLEMHSKPQCAADKAQVPRVWNRGRVDRGDPVHEWRPGNAFLWNDGPQACASCDHLASSLPVTKVP